MIALSTLAAQDTTAYDFTTVVQPGMKIGDFTFTDDTIIENIALNDQGEVAFIANWVYDQSGAIMRAVFTPQRMVAREGDIIEGRYIDALFGRELVINEAGNVGYEAAFIDTSAPWVVQCGVFIGGDHFALTTNRYLLRRKKDSDGKSIPPKPSDHRDSQREIPSVVNHHGDVLVFLHLEHGFAVLLGTRRGN